MRILLTGCNGQLGKCFLDRALPEWEILATDNKDLDITLEEKVKATFKKFKPDVVVNAAAYTAVDKAEKNVEAARATNALGPKYLAESCVTSGAFMLHVSTDYVFDGTASAPYVETDSISPNSVYGKTKAEGEEFVASSGAAYVTLRTAWVFSEYGNNFVKTMLTLRETSTEISVVADQFGGPTYAGDLAAAIIEVIKKKSKQENIESGIYHFCGTPIASWASFATEIFNQVDESGLSPKKITTKKITTADYPTPASRPAYSMMNCDKIYQKFKITTSNWKKSIQAIITQSDYFKEPKI